MADKITVEVVYALPDAQCLLTLQVEEGTTLLEAVRQAGLEEQFDELDLSAATFGMFGSIIKTPAAYRVSDHDRIEIYRPLLRDPKLRRKKKAVVGNEN